MTDGSDTFRPHEDPDLLRTAITLTAKRTTFSPHLIEKDYYCTLLLEYVANTTQGLIFKGGTCLAKVHAEFFRLSEDLDFVIPVRQETTRTQRRALISPFKTAFIKIEHAVPCFRVAIPPKGANDSTHYAATVLYQSLVTGQVEPVKIEVGLREPLLTPAVNAGARTLLLNPVSGLPLVPPVELICISLIEAFAEKFRAALSRREPAIRDFFDLDHAIRRLGLRPRDSTLIDLVRKKLSIPGNGPVDISQKRLADLRRQVQPQLKAVLRTPDYGQFDLERVFTIVAEMGTELAKPER